MTEHYFSAQPAGDFTTRDIDVVLAGKPVQVQTAGGVFSSDGLDRGTAVLLEHAPPLPESGRFLDVGCGWGPIALTMALERPAADVSAVDVNERSLELTRRNAARLGVDVAVGTPESVPADGQYDVIWSNPPIRIGKAALHELLDLWLHRLAPGGQAALVVQKNLGSDSLQRWLADHLGDGFTVSRHASDKGFRVLLVERGS